MWLPVKNDDGTQATHHDGRPLWQCPSGKHRLRGVNPKGDCGCKRPPLRLQPPTAAKPLDASELVANLTLLVTHFDRPEHLSRCLESIRKFYPDVAIIVGDNSINERPTVPDDVRLLIAEPDCGLSALRNKLVAHAETPYVAILEEDFIFTEETDLARLVDVLDENARVGIAAGSLWIGSILSALSIEVGSAPGAEYHFHDKRGPYNVTTSGTVWQRCDVVLNFFVASRDVLAANPWPEEIKIGDEHYKWFIDLSKSRNFDIAHVPAVTAQHDRTNRSEHYQAFRNRSEWKQLGNYISQEGLRGLAYRPPIVVFGVGHSGTTILTKMIAALGWKVPNNDAEYYEPEEIRAANIAMLSGREVDATGILRKLKADFLIKDPRMVVTLPQWTPAFAATASKFGSPLLIWIIRNPDDVAKSYERRGEPLDDSYQGMSVSELEALAFRRFQEWPWAKVQVRYEDLAAAVGLWETPTHAEEPEPLPSCKLLGEQLGEVGCGCGARNKKVPVFQCGAGLGPCTETSANKAGLRFNGEKVAVCLGCKINPDYRERIDA